MASLGRQEYIAPKEIAPRWQSGRSSVDRIARRNHFTRICLGEGENGMVRYLRKEVQEYEARRRVVMA
jgi:hypothetical protein